MLFIFVTFVEIDSLAKETCEKILDLDLTLDGNTTFVKARKLERAMASNRCVFSMKTSKSNGTIASMIGKTATGALSYFIIALNGGYVEVTFDSGKLNRRTIKSRERVDDGKCHVIDVYRSAETLRLKVDDTDPVNLDFPRKTRMIETDGTFRFGKVTDIPKFLPDDYKTGFEGCLTNIEIEKKHLLPDGIVKKGCVRQCCTE
ncbi:Uncharacterised protein g5229 [Pycnogonum litorale]